MSHVFAERVARHESKQDAAGEGRLLLLSVREVRDKNGHKKKDSKVSVYGGRHGFS